MYIALLSLFHTRAVHVLITPKLSTIQISLIREYVHVLQYVDVFK